MFLTPNRRVSVKKNDRVIDLAVVLDAIQGQSRIVIALDGRFANTTLLGKPASHITSALAKARKRDKPDEMGFGDTGTEATP